MMHIEITLEADSMRPGRRKFILRAGQSKGAGNLYPVVASARMDTADADTLAHVIERGARRPGVGCVVRQVEIRK